MLRQLLNGRKFDVVRIKNIKISKRLLKLKEPEKDYVLNFSYEEYIERSGLVPVLVANVGVLGIGFQSMGAYGMEKYNDYSIYYSSMLEAEVVKKEIEMKQEFMTMMDEKQEKTLEQKFKKWLK